MSLHLSAIAIKGDARAAMGAFFEDCDYALLGPPVAITQRSTLKVAMPAPEDKAVFFENGWTTVIDPELVLMLEDDVLAGLSARFDTVLTLVCEGASGTYGFSCYDAGRKVRVLLVVDGETIDEAGAPLPEERGTNYAKLFEDDIQRILAKLGYVFPTGEVATGFLVYHLRAADETIPGTTPAKLPEPPAPTVPSSVPERQTPQPWWKFWA